MPRYVIDWPGVCHRINGWHWKGAELHLCVVRQTRRYQVDNATRYQLQTSTEILGKLNICICACSLNFIRFAFRNISSLNEYFNIDVGKTFSDIVPRN